jgi:hypothetical protein
VESVKQMNKLKQVAAAFIAIALGYDDAEAIWI